MCCCNTWRLTGPGHNEKNSKGQSTHPVAGSPQVTLTVDSDLASANTALGADGFRSLAAVLITASAEMAPEPCWLFAYTCTLYFVFGRRLEMMMLKLFPDVFRRIIPTRNDKTRHMLLTTSGEMPPQTFITIVD